MPSSPLSWYSFGAGCLTAKLAGYLVLPTDALISILLILKKPCDLKKLLSACHCLVQEVLWAAKVPFEEQQGGGWSSVDRRAWHGLQIIVALRHALLRDQGKPVRTGQAAFFVHVMWNLAQKHNLLLD